MSRPRFTPGPWALCNDGDCTCGQVWSVPEDKHILSIGDLGIPRDVAAANAHLIAAAPDLYDFIATIENDDGRIPDWLWAKRNALLAKARGERP